MVKKLQAKLAKAKAKKGFTLVELIVVIAIIAVLAAILIPTLSSQIKKSQITSYDTTAKKLVEETNNFIADYTNKGGAYATAAGSITIDITGGAATINMNSMYSDSTVTDKTGTFEERMAEDMTWKANGHAAIYIDEHGKAYAAWYTESATAPATAGFSKTGDVVTPAFNFKDAKNEGVDAGNGVVVGTSPKVSGTGTELA